MENTTHCPKPLRRLRIVIQGAVQGVGFRPFIYNLAASFSLSGWVNNSNQGVFIEAEGIPADLDAFLLAIEARKPPHAYIQSLESSFLDPVGYTGFTIRKSDAAGDKTALILPDIATCPDCVREIFDPSDRRYRYPFTNCTHCGPRFTIVDELPYDRPHTSMAGFAMCEQCRTEYDNPADRRFHAQPNACPVCGPRLELWDELGAPLARDHEALLMAARFIEDGLIVAVKGIGGFHLMADAGNESAVRRLRTRKHREEKPLAMMIPSMAWAERLCRVGDAEKRLLRSGESPIVILEKHRQATLPIAEAVAPDNPYFGIMLPYSPLHHLLMAELGTPVVATSGNRSEEPICIDEHRALQRLSKIADRFLVHDRPILRHVDDSIACIRAGREQVLRRARGYAPLPVYVKDPLPPSIAVGAHLKNTVAMPVGNRVFVSQHIGDLETPAALGAFESVISDFKRLYDQSPKIMACDLHPDYASTRFARQSGLTVVPVQHHYAHILSCMAENQIEPPALGVAFDGTGYGPDQTIWGGEFLDINRCAYERLAHFRTFPLLGGDAAIREPRRSAMGLLYEMMGEGLFARMDLAPVRAFTESERYLVKSAFEKKLNLFRTSSAGRLFDAVAAILDVARVSRFEGQAAMALEFLAHGTDTSESYPMDILTEKNMPIVVDWAPMISAILEDLAAGADLSLISARFHNFLVEAIVRLARRAGRKRVVISGGCFQNRHLTEKTIARLSGEGFSPCWHQRIPPNDGGIALGQAMAITRKIRSAP